jgi:hypothetical protein
MTENHTPLWAHNDTGVTSHTDSSAHAHKWALHTACVSHGTQNVGTLVLLRSSERCIAEPLKHFGVVSVQRTIHPFFLRNEKVEMVLRLRAAQLISP